MPNHEITQPGPLLDAEGNLREAGWSRQPLLSYDRTRIKASPLRIKEWDYYLVMNNHYGAAFTISDEGYLGLESVSLLLFDEPWENTQSVLSFLPLGRLRMPPSSQRGAAEFRSGKLNLKFSFADGGRRIQCRCRHFDKKTFECDILLLPSPPPADSVCIAIPWPKAGHFYYNRKLNCLRAEGTMRFGDAEYNFNPKNSFATMDWGRGVWTYDNTWYWSSLNCDVRGKAFGFNLGYGFGDASAATENALFYNGKISKLEKAIFEIPKNLYDQWHLFTLDGRLEAVMDPVIDRSANLDFKAVSSNQHQVFGMMRGRAVLDGGKTIEFKDVMGFAERVHNKF
ncbi:MAG: DUF2804 domain-containing protein [Aeriscardovia sp.]|nr:DUF2804 domain-containing protein [Aeriscardovia sp.]